MIRSRIVAPQKNVFAQKSNSSAIPAPFVNRGINIYVFWNGISSVSLGSVV